MWRVTTVIALSGLKPDVPAFLRERMTAGQTRGAAVHETSEGIALGEDTRPDQHAEFTDGVRAFFAKWLPTVLFTEQRNVARTIRLTGRIDLGITLPGYEDPFIVDYKRGAPQEWHKIQTGGYAELARRTQPQPRWNRACLYLPGGGKYKFVMHTDPRDIFLFNSALALLQWRKDHGLLAYTDPERPHDDGDRPVSGGGADAAAAGDQPDGFFS